MAQFILLASGIAFYIAIAFITFFLITAPDFGKVNAWHYIKFAFYSVFWVVLWIWFFCQVIWSPLPSEDEKEKDSDFYGLD